MAILATDDSTRRGARDVGELAVEDPPLVRAVNKNFQQVPGGSVVPVPSQSSQSNHAFDANQAMAGANTMDPVWQRLWLRCQQHDWQSMAFIGSSKRDPDGVLEIAHGMARLASELGQELTVFDARNLGLKDMGRMLAQIQSITSRGKRCIVVLKLVTENATTVPMAQNVDAALLGVFIGETSVVASSRTVEEVGRAKFLGSVVLNASLAK